MSNTVTYEGEAGLFSERLRARAEGFIVGQQYQVQQAMRGTFHTSYVIVGKPGTWNSVLFKASESLPMIDTYYHSATSEPQPNVVQSDFSATSYDPGPSIDSSPGDFSSGGGDFGGAGMEIKEGLNFLNPEQCKFVHFDWVVTNPPWSKVREFLQRSMEVADNIVFLMTVNHCWTKARVRDVKQAGFGLKEILLCDMPKEFPQSGFQLGAMHWQRGWTGDIKLSSL